MGEGSKERGKGSVQMRGLRLLPSPKDTSPSVTVVEGREWSDFCGMDGLLEDLFYSITYFHMRNFKVSLTIGCPDKGEGMRFNLVDISFNPWHLTLTGGNKFCKLN